jgi:hypothetical protein
MFPVRGASENLGWPLLFLPEARARRPRSRAIVRRDARPGPGEGRKQTASSPVGPARRSDRTVLVRATPRTPGGWMKNLSSAPRDRPGPARLAARTVFSFALVHRII